MDAKSSYFNWFGKGFEVGSQGMCHWEKVWFIDLRSGKEFYRLERDLTDFKGILSDDYPRQEYFEGKLEREYKGWQSCFIEFCNELISFVKKRTFPAMKDFNQAIVDLRLDQKTGQMYIYYYQKFFGRR